VSEAIAAENLLGALALWFVCLKSIMRAQVMWKNIERHIAIS